MTVEQLREMSKNHRRRKEPVSVPPKDALKPAVEEQGAADTIDTTPVTVQDTVDPVITEHYPALAKTVHACLAVFGSMALAGRTKPISLILETASGYGKSAVLQMFFPIAGNGAHEGMRQYVYRSDKFSPKAFVSHVGNVRKNELANIDLLPKLKNKVLVTKELAPIFRGREEEMQENFANLISVLDGQGFTSDSGTRGKRGYEEPILFNWIGATTPLPDRTHRMMSQLGTRFLFYEVPAIELSEEQLIEYCENDAAGKAEKACQEAVNEFLGQLFRQYPVGKLASAGILIPKVLMKDIVRWAKLVIYGRAEIKCEQIGREWEPVAAGTPEGPFKVINYFKDLCRGHALIHGRMEVNESDLAFIGDVAISSIPGHLRPIIRALREFEILETKDAARLCKVSATTGRRYLEELALLGLAVLTEGNAMSNAPHRVRLAESFQWIKNLESKV